jgi:hypothetical protein
VVGPNRSDHLHALGAAHASHLGAERLGQLDREAAHPARGADDHDRLAWLDPSGVAQRLEGSEPGDGNGRSLLEGEVGRLPRQLALGHTEAYSAKDPSHQPKTSSPGSSCDTSLQLTGPREPIRP